ncbi:MAG: hypothetical protein HY097_05080 [Nitrospinae bacterium]|nr:hypothetical protein [Nitrospinota bacterium]MBI3813985.1 hypothetical protein [Nitrospinota bacterium]
MKNNADIITLLSEGHNFSLQGFWRTTDISREEIHIESSKPINGLYRNDEIIEVSLFPVESPPICIQCSFTYINQSEFELRIIDFPSLKDRQLYNKLLEDKFYYKNAISSGNELPSAEKFSMYVQ